MSQITVGDIREAIHGLPDHAPIRLSYKPMDPDDGGMAIIELTGATTEDERLAIHLEFGVIDWDDDDDDLYVYGDEDDDEDF